MEDGDLFFLVVDEEDKKGNDIAASDEQNDDGDEEEQGSIALELEHEIFGEFKVTIGVDFPIFCDALRISIPNSFPFLSNSTKTPGATSWCFSS